RAGIAAAACAFAIGALRLIGYWPGWNAHVDQWLFRSQLEANVMAPNTAAAFVLASAALLLLNARLAVMRWLAQTCVLSAGTIALLSLTGYYYSTLPFSQLPHFIPMALNTALAFAVLSIGILCARPQREPAATVVSNTAGGLLARRLLPAAFLVPLL